MAFKKDFKSLVGQLFIVGFDGYSISTEYRKFIQEYKLGGVIYFKRNVQSPAQLAELANEIQFSCRPADYPFLFTSIDHEGGKVNRLVKPFTKFPGNDYLGDINSPKVGFEFGMVLGKELKAIGINMNYAPVVDVNSNKANPVINTRAFSDDPEICGKLGSAVCRGIQKMGVVAVAKHFPGHGDTKEDSHLALPRINKSLAEMEKMELIPFKRVFRSRVEAVMTAHILNDAIDPEYPATMSYKTIGDLLRTQMRYSKLVISDDMEMKAITDHYGAEEAAILSINAGCDLLIYRGEQGPPTKVMDAVLKPLRRGVLSSKPLRRPSIAFRRARKIMPSCRGR